MKQSMIWMVLSAAVLWTCYNAGENSTKTGDSDTAEIERKADGRSDDVSATLKLDEGGKKWKADSITGIHALKIEQLINTFNGRTDHVDNEYVELTNNIQGELDQLIRDCKMKGPAHQALHTWLESVLLDTQELKSSKTQEERKKSIIKLTVDIKKFREYFE